jgi:hypothetical protein
LESLLIFDDDATLTSYITITLHFTDSNWDLESKILATLPMFEEKTAVNIKTVATKVLHHFGFLRTGTGKLIFTDNGSSVKAVFHDYFWIPCSGQNLNLVLSHGLDNKDAANDPALEEIMEQIKLCKTIVTHVKRTKIQSLLETTLKQTVSTWWNSKKVMLESVASNLDTLKVESGKPGKLEF